MKLSLETAGPADARADVLVVGRHIGAGRPGPEVLALDKRLGGLMVDVLTSERFEGKAGQISQFHSSGRIAAGRVLVVGLGPKKTGDAEAVRRGAAAAVRRARDLGASSVAVFMSGDGLTARERAHAVVEGASLGTYRFDRYLKEKSDKVIQSLSVVEPVRTQHAAAREGLRVGEIFAGATCLARDLVNEPANVLTPSYLARRAEEIARAGKLGLEVLERADCAKLAMGAYLGVAQGSQ
jgi:leucyl aminopeptidase